MANKKRNNERTKKYFLQNRYTPCPIASNIETNFNEDILLFLLNTITKPPIKNAHKLIKASQ